MQKSLDSVVFVCMHLNHVVQRFLIAQSEALSDVQHVNLRAEDHDADQSVISRAQTLQTDGKMTMHWHKPWELQFHSFQFILTGNTTFMDL